MAERRCGVEGCFIHHPIDCEADLVLPLSSGASARTARVLVLMVIPGQLIFMVAIYFLRQNGETQVTAAFVSIYLTAALMQVGEGESI